MTWFDHEGPACVVGQLARLGRGICHRLPHCTDAESALHTPAWAGPVVLTGGTGVTLFFVASAFSLCLAARLSEDRGFPLAVYALRRLFRIAPLFYVALAVSLLRDRWLLSASHSIGAVAASVAFVFNFFPGWETGIVWASWTIGVEMPFYCVFPFLEARSRTVITAVTLVLALLLAAALWPQAALLHWAGLPQPIIDLQIQFGLMRHLPVFGFGILAYRLYERFIERRPLPASLGVALLLGAGCLYAALLRGRVGPAPFTDGYYWQAVIYSAVVLGLVIYPSPFIVNRLTLHMGKVSYSLYLLHPFVVFAMSIAPSRLGVGLQPLASGSASR